MLEILRHFAVKTDQTYDSMTVLLSLLKEHQPIPDYTNLPSTGKGLLPLNTFGELPSPELVYDKSKRVVIGKYVHFGLELALMGNSPGIYFKHADLIQYAAIFATNPELVHDELKQKVKKLNWCTILK